MSHAAHRMHENSLEAHRSERENLSKRARVVFDWIRQHGPCTDRDVMRGLGFTDMNAVRPRVTEMVDDGFVEELHTKAICPITHKRVRMVRVKPYESQQLVFT